MRIMTIAAFVVLLSQIVQPSYAELVEEEDVIQVSDIVTYRADNKKAQRVVAFFNVYKKNGVEFHCPVKIRAVDDACGEASGDPGVVCREPGPASGTFSTIQKLKWRARGPSYMDGTNEIDPTFTVKFASGYMPCKEDNDNGTPNDTSDDFWNGSVTPDKVQKCKLKPNAYFNVSDGKSAYIKYDIVGVAPAADCEPLDPYFIIRN